IYWYRSCPAPPKRSATFSAREWCGHLTTLRFSLSTKSRMKKPDTNIEFVDTHCHSYDTEFIKQFKSDSSPEKIIEEAQVAGVKNIICVGTNSRDSKAAVDFCNNRDGCYATVA